MWEAILAFLTGQIGTRNDAPKCDGSLHAKVSSLDTKFSSLDTKISSLDTKISSLDISRKNPKINVVNGSSSSFSPFNIRGSGYLIGLGIYADKSYPRLTVTIDGNTLVSSGYVYSTAFVLPLLHRFNQNVNIVLRFDTSNNVTAMLTYILD